MKRIFFLLLSLTILTSGCFSGEKNNDKPIVQDDQKDIKNSVAIHPTESNFSTENLTLLNQRAVDIDSDSNQEQIEVYTAAERLPDGTMAWDDGQKWFVLVKDGNKEYLLFNEFIQLGELKYWTSPDSGDFSIAVLIEGGNGIQLYDYVFDAEKRIFVKNKVFSSSYRERFYLGQLT